MNRANELDALMAAPNAWDNAEAAQKIIDERRLLTKQLGPLTALSRGADDLTVLLEFAQEDDSLAPEIREQEAALGKQLYAAELQASMSKPEDAGNAYMTVQAGEGGTDSADFAQMLMRMYARWADLHDIKVELLDESPGEEAGIRNATLHFVGDYAFGFLKGETGNHRLVRISPFDSAGRRHTAFAAVDVTPDLDDENIVEIDWAKDIREDVYRASGAGGQHVNKTSSAIRLTHLPTNVVATCQNERSQHQNRAAARKMLIAKLYQLGEEKKAASTAARRGEKCKIGFGGQTIRNYVLQPEQFVKDTRSDLKTGNPLDVLEGQLDPFIEAYLRWSITGA